MELLKSDKVDVYDHRENKYSESLQKCVHRLLEHNVSSTQFSKVIEVCLDLAGKEANHVLSDGSTIRKMYIQRGVISSL